MVSFKNITRWLVVSIACAGMIACNVDEDESDCVTNMRLTFRFTKDGQEQFGAEVPSLSVFVFDGHKKFVGRWDENDNSKFNANYTMSLPLTPGAYSFVVWGGLKDNCYYICSPGSSHGQATAPVKGQTAMSDMILRLACDTRSSFESAKNFVDYVPGALFFGQTGEMTLQTGGSDIVVDLAKNSKRINLTIIGLPDAYSRTNPYPHMNVSMDSPNGGHDFRNGLEQDCSQFTYVQHEAVTGGTDIQRSVLHTLSMKFDNGHKLTIYNTDTGRAFYTADLLEDYIRKVSIYNSQDAVDAKDEFDITLDVRSSLGVSVSVDGWNVGLSGSIIQ